MHSRMAKAFWILLAATVSVSNGSSKLNVDELFEPFLARFTSERSFAVSRIEIPLDVFLDPS
jgi:hypothetical protein